MKRKFTILLYIFCIVLVYSCKPKLTCAAYHSSFILMPEHQDKRFSPFGLDSIPKGYNHNKDEHGLSIGPDIKSYSKRHYNIPMQNIYPLPSEKKAGDNDYNISDSLGVAPPVEIPNNSTNTNIPNNNTEDTPEEMPEVIPGAEEEPYEEDVEEDVPDKN